MNREYRIMMIALCEGTPEDYNVELTEEDKESIEWYKKESKKAKNEGKSIVFYAPDED
ncbi:hypothetical protein [uncultured Anaerococcus sp.]|uniref:hypothetical protein n=1 Tax=uncultured Anaerococcus sp. TaxID=293428 RepID=UPI00288AEF44|nr:hypothetical protein [uncultured Anaerococcus sp.]